MAIQLTGIGVSRGIAIGRAHVLQRGELEVIEYGITRDQVDEEIQRFRAALQVARGQLRAIRNRIPPDTRADIVEFIDTHLLMLEDSTLTAAPEQIIRDHLCNAEWALKLQRDALVRVFEEMDDPYLRTRRDDVDHVVNRIQRILLQADGDADGSQAFVGAILLADDLTPADTVLMQHQGILAFVTDFGGPLSHTAIVARSLHIPAVVGVHNGRRYIRDGERIIVDGRRGVILVDTDEAIRDQYAALQKRERRRQAQLARLRNQPAVTRDAVPVALQANIELPDDVDDVLRVQAHGVGLYRTEFLYMNRNDTPDEEEQFQCYAGIVERLGGLPLTIRTLDLGADKQPQASGETPVCSNPALGLRAIRLCLHDPALFLPQIRAILRASALGPVRLMLPMLSSAPELSRTFALIQEARRGLARDGMAFDPAMPVGGMIEVPAAALMADFFARQLDFLSLGTNDLIQYTLAIDRVDDEVNYLYDPLHPAVLRLVQDVIDAGRRAGTPVAMCGEMAGDPDYTRLLLGLGLREFSMEPSSLLEVKRIVKRSDTRRLREQVLPAVASGDPATIRGLFERLTSDVVR